MDLIMEKNTFSNPAIALARRLYSEYAFTLQGIPELIRLRIYQNIQDECFEVEQSHYLQSPAMAAPAFCDAGPFVRVEEALNEILAVFTTPYQDAIAAGLQPTTDWLLPNRDFS